MEFRLRRLPTAAEIRAAANSIAKHDFVSGLSRLRVYFLARTGGASSGVVSSITAVSDST
jgi:hypothetical protein